MDKSNPRFAPRRTNIISKHRRGNIATVSVSYRHLKSALSESRDSAQLQFRWPNAISQKEWHIYRLAIETMENSGVPFLLGGGFALATFTGRWRDTKDIDFYVLPQDRPAAIKALSQAGFKDYFKRLRYDRRWIYRSVKSDVIVDIIWSMANRRARVDRSWFAGAQTVSIRGKSVLVLPMEEFLWCKLYILQRDHCDWTDIFNLLYARGPQVNWPRLLARLDEDVPLLKGLLSVYGWLCPKSARELPDSLWRTLKLEKPKVAQNLRRDRIRLLDSRAWFAALQPRNKKLQV